MSPLLLKNRLPLLKLVQYQAFGGVCVVPVLAAPDLIPVGFTLGIHEHVWGAIWQQADQIADI